jgi:hypothetical protein
MVKCGVFFAVRTEYLNVILVSTRDWLQEVHFVPEASFANSVLSKRTSWYNSYLSHILFPVHELLVYTDFVLYRFFTGKVSYQIRKEPTVLKLFCHSLEVKL